MAKKIVSYLLEGDGSIPLFIENGGYFPKGHELLGLSVDESARHVPSTVVRLTTRQSVIDWITLSGVAEGQDPEDVADAWLAQVGFQYE